MTFTCAHFDPATDGCVLLKTDCVPGRPGCVLRGRSQFLVPVEERIREAEERRRQRLAAPPVRRSGQGGYPDSAGHLSRIASERPASPG